jgi:hypothetical protein
MAFWDMVDALPPEQRERILRQQAEQFACDPEPAAPPVAVVPADDKTKDIVKP